MHAVMWCVWKEMNRRLFEEKFNSKGEVIDSIMREVGSWLSVLNESKELPPSLFLRDKVSSLKWAHPKRRKELLFWIPPHSGSLKLNFDGAFKANPGQVGFGHVIWDHDHNIIRTICGPHKVCNVTKAEAISLLMGLRELNRLKLKGCEMEGDSAAVSSWGMGNCMGSWDLAPVI